MEDAHIVEINLQRFSPDLPENSSLYGVFDGHGGKLVALFCQHYFTQTLVGLQTFIDKN